MSGRSLGLFRGKRILAVFPRRIEHREEVLVRHVVGHNAERNKAKSYDIASNHPLLMQSKISFLNTIDSPSAFLIMDSRGNPTGFILDVFLHSQTNKSYVFNAPASSIEALANINFNLFVLANNHIYDKGRKGMLETIQQFKKRNLQYSGAGKTKNDVDIPVIKEINGVKIAVWSFTHFVNDDYNQKDSSWVSIFKEKDAVNKIKKWKDSVDVTIVTFHGGEEYKQKPLKKHIEAFHGMLDAGAMVIIGSHPHVPQPVEIYETIDGRETAIFYSLGNFMANQSRKYKHPVSSLEYGDTRDALVASFSLTLVDYGPLGKKWEVHNVGVIPCWIENNYNDVLRGKNGKKENKGENIIKRDIRVVSVYDEMDNIDMGLDTLLQKIEFKKANKIDSLNVKKLIKNKRHFLNRLKRIKKVVGDEFVKRPD